MEIAAALVVLSLGPAILLVLLPVIPTVWLMVVYPVFGHMLKKMGVKSMKKRLALFYVFSVVCCMPAFSYIRDAVHDPGILLPVITSKGFVALTAYSITAPFVFSRIERSVLFKTLKIKLINKFFDLKDSLAVLQSPEK